VLQENDIILVFGSMNANADDRSHTREEIRTLQFIDHRYQLQSTNLFQQWGELGLSSMVFLPDSQSKFFITTGRNLFLIDFDTEWVVKPIDIPKLRGVHELSIIKNLLWISNTYYDEVIAYDYQKGEVKQRFKLTPGKIDTLDEASIDPEDVIRVNKFHCNQIFESYEGDEYLLVHHVTGEQIVKKVAQKLVKSQGGGGVLSVDTRERHKLRMKAPHSVRLVEGNYWVFDSGHGELAVFDKNWKPVDRLDLAGWGRGGCYLPHSQVFFAGISAPRRRYLKFLDTSPKRNKVMAIDSQKMSILKTWELTGVEQVNNLYYVNRKFLNQLQNIKSTLDEYTPQ
jgi:hypothetical protein